MFSRGVKSSNPFFLAWKAFKAASLPTEKEALDSVLGSHTPKIIPKGKAHGGRKVPEGASRFNPTSKEWRDILDPPEEIITPAKKAKVSATAGKKTAERKKTSRKTSAKATKKKTTQK